MANDSKDKENKTKKGAKKATGKAPQAKKTAKPKAGEETRAAASPSDQEAKPKKAARPPGTPPKPARKPLMERTYWPRHGELSKWRLVDAAGQPLGRLSSY